MEEIGKYIWLEDEEEHGWVPVKIIQILANKYIVHANINNDIIEYEIKKGEIDMLEVHTSCLEGVDDLLCLGDFNEPTLLQNTRARFYQNKIYSFIGSPILISVNPYKRLDIYCDNFIRYFRDFFMKMKQDSTLLQSSVPHLYYVAEAAYQEMIAEKKNQSIIISGESGSGKTESTKIILKYLAVASEISNSSGKAKNEDSVEKQVLDSNPLLEAFGNAKTIKNNNSSRFGKFINVNFTEYGKIISAKIYNYLLEKSRIVKTQDNERNYHIFFQLLSGANEIEKAKFMLKDPSYFNYLKHGCLEIEDTDDKANFLETKDCMLKLNLKRFSNDEIHLIFSVLVGILYLGNVEFVHEKDIINVSDETKEDYRVASEFIGVDQQSLMRILTIRKMTDPLSKKQIDKPMNIEQVFSCRDTIAKTLYARMFDWIIKKINNAISSNQEKEKNLKMKKIGILDIFGFEIFEENSFEQMCINYANERLQQFFNNHIFKMEQEEYMREKIDWSQVSFKDNKDIIDLIDNPQKSIFSLLDSQGFIKNTNDRKLKDTIYANLIENKSLVLNKKRPDSLIIKHYAGEVEYNITGFIEKNDDQLNNDIVEAFEISKNKLIKYLFKKVVVETKKEKEKVGPNKLQSDSLSKQFKKQLDELIKMLSQSNPRYVKCIKPNNQKTSGIFESLDVNRQLLSAGVLESIKIRKQGYSIRRTHEEFVRKYLPLTPGIDHKNGGKFSDISLEMIKYIANIPEFKNSFNNNKKLIQVGINKIFMKDEVKIFLECKLNQTYMQYIIKIQSYVRRQKQTNQLKKVRLNVSKIKKKVKWFLLRKKFKKFRSRLILKDTIEKFSKKIVIGKIAEAIKTLCNYIKEKKRSETFSRNKNRRGDIDKLKDRGKTSDKINQITSEKSFKQVTTKKSQIKNTGTTNLNESNSSINKNKDLLDLLTNIKCKKSKGRIDDLFKIQNEPVVNQILSTEYIAKIEILTEENYSLKEEKIMLKEHLSIKEQEIVKLRRKLNETGNYQDESLKFQLDNLDNDMEKLKSGLQQRASNKQQNNLNSEKSNYCSEEMVMKTRLLEDELRKYNKEIFDKDSIIYTMKIQLDEQTKNNKFLADLCDTMKNQINKNKDKVGLELESLFDQKKEFEKEKYDLLQKQNINSSRSPIISLKRASDKNDTDLRNKIHDVKKESLLIDKKIEEIMKKTEKERQTYENQLNLKEKRLHEYEVKINSLENDLRKRTEEYINLKDEYNLCKEKIPELKNKLDTIHKSKLNRESNDINSLRENYESKMNQKMKEVKKFENEISDLTLNVEKMKKIEILLKDELFKKGSELAKANEVMKTNQTQKEQIMDENIKLKKEVNKIKRNSLNDNVVKEFETEIKVYKQNILLLEDEKNLFKKKNQKEKDSIKNKSEQNYTMVDLLKVMKQQISLLQNFVKPTSELIVKFKDLQTNENKVLVDLQKIAENQISDSEPEYDEDESEEVENC